jgi:ABC-type sugar transport system substrate-binding protein
MRRFLSVFVLFLAIALLAHPAFAAAKFHIGVVTGTVSQGEDVVRGAEALMAKYGEATKGGMIRHVTYPDNFSSEMETVISQISGLADDPDMKVVVVMEGIPGTTEAFRRIKERRSDIICLVGQPQEDPNIIGAVADLAVNSDTLAMGYIMPAAAKKLGAKTYVHISFPRHMSYELLSRRRKIMEEACKDIGLKFVFETAPDPTSDVGVAGAQQYVLEKTPSWINKYGKKTAFFSTNDAQVEPLLKQIAAYGGYYVQTDSPLQGYAGALGIDLSKEKGDWKAILEKIERTVVEKGGKGRLCTWPYPSGYCIVAGLGEFGKRVVEGEAKLDSMEDAMKAFEVYSPGMAWNSNYYTDLSTETKMKNFLLIYQDTYVFGKGALHMDKITVPDKYYKIK